MARRLDANAPGFARDFAALLGAKREISEDVDAEVADIIADVRARGAAALIDYTRRFDGLELTAHTIRVDPGEVEAAEAACAPEALAALRLAAERIEAFHARHTPKDDSHRDAQGVELGARWTPLESVGIYVPGGAASYPSSTLMNAIPAQVAGVDRIAMAVPSPHGEINPLVLAAARLAGVDEIYRVGGAQAIAALAYGAGPIHPVDKIVGPGNAWVAAAKRRVFGEVGIDMIAGPSEICVVADGLNHPDWIALDLLSQAEHDPSSQSILITDDAGFATRVAAAVEARLAKLPRQAIARASWRDFGAIILVGDPMKAAPLVDLIAPEHLELALEEPDLVAAHVRHAGAIFLGRHTPEAVGDYVAGPNHVLPTARSARFSSGLSALDFMKRTTVMRCDARALSRIGPAAMILAEAEGLDAHRLSIAARLADDV